MFNITETLWNNFTCELLPDNLINEVALHFYVKLAAAIFSSQDYYCTAVPGNKLNP